MHGHELILSFDGSSHTKINHSSIFEDNYALVGNGWCKGSNDARIQKDDNSFDWQPVNVGTDNSAEACEISCLNKIDCIGYMTEDGDKCDIILSSDVNAAEGISHVDSEARNYCWIKYKKGMKNIGYVLC